MNATPAASVIVPALNAEATLPDLLAALKAQSGVPGPFEIIVVDNGSTDRTAEVARASGARVLHQPVRGPAAARNMGLASAKAEIIACTDADTIPTRRWLAALFSAFTDPQTIQATGPILGWQPSTPAERFACARQVFDCEHTAAHPTHPFAHGMNVVVRRAAAREIGGWDETMTSGEDVDFSIRLRKKFGMTIRFVDQAILFHKHRSKDEALWKQARWHGAGLAMVWQKHPELTGRHAVGLGSLRVSLFMLQVTAPLVTLARATHLISEQRAEFEHYHRQWTRHFWAAFFEQRRKKPA
jgi:glycosyltransferase involved in cell wall biosynthesis